MRQEGVRWEVGVIFGQGGGTAVGLGRRVVDDCAERGAAVAVAGSSLLGAAGGEWPARRG